jgi:hypothetical protein
MSVKQGPNSCTEESYCNAIRQHYIDCWRDDVEEIEFRRGPITDLSSDFRVLRFAPRPEREIWTYATQCMSQPNDESRIEIHIFAPQENGEVVELLVATAHYHRTGAHLSLGHGVNFGRPWWPGSLCDHGLISLPYLDGPRLEWLQTARGCTKIRFLWLIPVTSSEVEFARKNGIDALETRFQMRRFNYVDPRREAVA